MRVLIVEDDPVTLEACEAFVQGLGHETGRAIDGESAWRSISTEYYHVIISDWSLPGLSGLELCRGMRARKSTGYPYFILITSFQGRDKLAEAMHAGVDDFLTKPIDMGALAVRLHVSSRIIAFHAHIGALQGMLPICMYCKKIRNDQAYWETVEAYFKTHMGTDFTHSLCPNCYETHILPELEEIRGESGKKEH